jgi:hypothetical protein
MIPIILRISLILTITASKALKTSNKYIKLLAKVFKIISAKKHVRNAVSIFDRMNSLMPNMSAKVSQKRMKIV